MINGKFIFKKQSYVLIKNEKMSLLRSSFRTDVVVMEALLNNNVLKQTTAD